jgi:hypothetical protein
MFDDGQGDPVQQTILRALPENALFVPLYIRYAHSTGPPEPI